MSPADDLENVLYHAFEAKANAEIVSGVGYEWNAEILISENRVHTIPEKIRKIMDQLFTTHTAGSFGSVDEDDSSARHLEKHPEEVFNRSFKG